MKNILLSILILSIMFSFTSCTKQGESKIPEIAEESMETARRDSGTPLPIHTPNKLLEGKSFSIILNTNPTTGFDWKFEYKGEGLLNNYMNEQSTPPRGITGSGFQRAYFFKAERPGDCDIVFSYKRDWEGGDTSTIMTYSFKIDANLNIKFVSRKIDQGPGYAENPDFYNGIEGEEN